MKKVAIYIALTILVGASVLLAMQDRKEPETWQGKAEVLEVYFQSTNRRDVFTIVLQKETERYVGKMPWDDFSRHPLIRGDKVNVSIKDRWINVKEWHRLTNRPNKGDRMKNSKWNIRYCPKTWQWRRVRPFNVPENKTLQLILKAAWHRLNNYRTIRFGSHLKGERMHIEIRREDIDGEKRFLWEIKDNEGTLHSDNQSTYRDIKQAAEDAERELNNLDDTDWLTVTPPD